MGSGHGREEVLLPLSATSTETPGLEQRDLAVPLVRSGDTVSGLPTLEQSRSFHSEVMVTLPWEGLALSQGDPAVNVRVVPPAGN